MLGHQSCTAPGGRNLPADAVSALAPPAGGRQRGGGGGATTTPSPSMRTPYPPARRPRPARGRPSARRVAEADDDLVAVDAHRVPPDAQPAVDRAAAGCDLEVPLVPRAADEGVRRAESGPPVAQLDGGRDPPARAQRR